MLSASGTGSPPNRLPPPARSRTSHTVILFLHIHRLFKTLSKDRNYFVKIPFRNPGLSRTDRGTNHTARTARAREQKYRTATFPRGTAACSTNRYLICHAFFSARGAAFRQTPGCSPDITPPRTKCFPNTTEKPVKQTDNRRIQRSENGLVTAGSAGKMPDVQHPPHPLSRRKQKDMGENDVSRPPWRPGNDSKDTACPRRFKIYRKAARSATGRALRTVRPP